MKMETTFYHDESVDRDAVKKLKSNMTLDFTSSSKTKQQKLGGVLASPDLQMLKLASPELERMIIQQNGMVTTTPTPTQFLCPKFVTEEQEAYARGFVDALNELHKQKQPEPTGPTAPPNVAVTNALSEVPFTTVNLSQAYAGTNAPTSSYATVTTTLASANHADVLPHSSQALVSEVLQASRTRSPLVVNTQAPANARVLQLKEEPQTVPCLGNTPPLSPINMDNQERIKLERKRARNRVAARKCRTRKLERISRLEDRVRELKGQNNDLSTTATQLRDQVCRLKQQIMDHVGSGCQVMLSQNLL